MVRSAFSRVSNHEAPMRPSFEMHRFATLLLARPGTGALEILQALSEAQRIR